jgi:hypothetical protein
MLTESGRRMSPTQSPLKEIIAAYHLLTVEQKQAWHRVTVENSRAPWDVALLAPFVAEMERITKAFDTPEDDVAS